MLDAWWPGSIGTGFGQIATGFSVAFGAASPVVLLVLQGRQKRQDYREKVAETAQERVDRITREQLSELTTDRDRYRALFQAEENAHIATRRDRDAWAEAGRAMEQFAHEQRHDHANLLMNARTYRSMIERVCGCELSTRQAASTLAQAGVLPETVPPVPALRVKETTS